MQVILLIDILNERYSFITKKIISKYFVQQKFQGALKWAILMYKQYHITGYNFEDDVNDFAYVADNVA